MTYLLLKWLHIVSATVLFGTGLGTAFFMWMAHRSRNVEAIAVTSRHVVIADWIFTTPAVIIQPVSGVALALLVGYPLTSAWLVAASVLYVVAGACWVPVVFLQMKAQKLAAHALAQGTPLPPHYFRFMRWWFWLGWPAFIALLITFYLMIAKPM